MKKIISIDLKSDFAFFKNPEFNGELESKHYSFDSIHKLSLLGIFGSLVGLGGIRYTEGDNFLPEYYNTFKYLKIGIRNINDRIEKTWIKINSGSGLYSKEPGGVLNLDYHVIINPNYRIYVLLDTDNEKENELYSVLKDNLSGYFGSIHFGKSYFIISRENFKEYDFYKKEDVFEGVVNTIFECEYKLKTSRFDKNENINVLGFLFEKNSNIKYERMISLPKEYIKLKNGKNKYDKYKEFVFTNKEIVAKSDNFYILNNNECVYLF